MMYRFGLILLSSTFTVTRGDGLISGGGASSAAPLQSVMNVVGPAPARPSNIYRIAYLGGRLLDDILPVGGGDQPTPALDPSLPLELPDPERPAVGYDLYELPEDGVLPDVLRGDSIDPNGERPSFSAFLRYHYDNVGEVQRVRDWIATHGAICRDIFVVSYPAENPTAEILSAMMVVVNSFATSIGSNVRSFAAEQMPDQVGRVTALLRFYAARFPRHRPPSPPPSTDVYRWVYVGALIEDFRRPQGQPPRILMQKTVTLNDATHRVRRVDIRQAVGANNEPPAAWANGGVSFFAAILRFHGDSMEDVARIRNWIELNANRYREVLLVSYPTSALSAEVAQAVAELGSRNVKTLLLQPNQDGSAPSVESVIERILPVSGGPHAIQPPTTA